MDFKSIFSVFLNNEYQIMNSNIASLKIFVKEFKTLDKVDRVNIIVCVSSKSYEDFLFESMDNIIFQIERKFLMSGVLNINKLCLIFTDNVERDKRFSDIETNFWLIDMLAERLIIFENQPVDFDGLKEKLENTININNNERNLMHKENMSIVTLLLVVINVVIFIYLSVEGDTKDAGFMLKNGAMYNKTVFKELELYRFITCLFLHFDTSHLFSNMMSLVFIGNEVERRYGKIKFSLIYFLSGIIGSMISVVYYNFIDENVVSAGASGAIYGLMGAVLVNIIQNKQKNNIKISKIVLVFILLFMSGKSGANVDVFAHLGGLLGGMLVALGCYLHQHIKNS